MIRGLAVALAIQYNYLRTLGLATNSISHLNNLSLQISKTTHFNRRMSDSESKAPAKVPEDDAQVRLAMKLTLEFTNLNNCVANN